ncbi:unnamed protein product [Parascedosporium putredinis]|uniref:Ipa protein n=1 Tax=Parascedosporium putredinis TaxID=1442378 RepID=A0A9P1GZA6_9PEZI|nr:unnamed protein product [Parascedosporium putredinis]CAI7991609.1 unnamed protein product [Parascedosporium putredinis]
MSQTLVSSLAQSTMDLHADLVSRYKRHHAAVEKAWRSFDKQQRAKCMKAGAAEGVVLKHALDHTLGNVNKIIPEWNLRDVCEDPEHALAILKHRATNTLMTQYAIGHDGGLGDKNLIHKMMVTLERGLCIREDMGNFVLQRQMTLIQVLVILIDDILEEGSETRDKSAIKSKPDKAAAAAFSRLTVSEPQAKVSLPALVENSRDQKESLEEYLRLLTEEPVVLTHAVNNWFYSRTELLPDEKGRRLPVHGDKYISGAVLDALRNTVQGVAIWEYITGAMELFAKPGHDKAYRAMLLQELSNVCQMEYERTQAVFKRQVQTASGDKYIKRVSNAYDKAGNAKVSMKGKPEDFTLSDPQLMYILRLCQPETNVVKAYDWVKKLGELHATYPEESEKMEEREAEALYDLMIIVSFVHDLSTVVTLPSVSKKTGQRFISEDLKLQTELNKTPEAVVETRKQKEKVKTRPPHSSVYNIAPATASDDEEVDAPSGKIKVNSSTYDVFSSLFTKDKSRGSVNWTSFEGAMASLGFSVLPKFGSIYTFSPPESMGVKRSITIHRPHQSRIEGYLVPIFARRLKRVFGWGQDTFEVA